MDNYDIRLKENFKLFISGPSRCGKTFFVAELLENINTFAKVPPATVFYVYKVWQTKFDEMKSLIDEFIQDNENVVNHIQEKVAGQPILIIFDDLINSKSLFKIGIMLTLCLLKIFFAVLVSFLSFRNLKDLCSIYFLLT